METKICLPLGTAGVRNEFPPDNAGNGAKRASALEPAVLICMIPSSRGNFVPVLKAKEKEKGKRAKAAAKAEIPKAPEKGEIPRGRLRDPLGNHLASSGSEEIAEIPKIVSKDGIVLIA